MRFTGPVRVTIRGDQDLGQRYITVARTFLGTVVNQLGLAKNEGGLASRLVTLPDGARILVRQVTENVHDIVIDVQSVTSALFTEALQYMFSVRGIGSKTAPVVEQNGRGVVTSAWAGLFVAFTGAGEADITAVPIVSTREDIQPTDEDSWVFIGATGTTAAEIAEMLPIPRYEIAHAEAMHLFLPDKQNIVHAPWMQKGQPPYNAYAWSKSTEWNAGVGSGTVTEGGNTFVTSQEEFFQFGATPTDIGYETDLAIYRPPEAQGVLTSGQSVGGVPDMDWYTSYARAVVDEREFGIAIDANQVLHVWPTSAEGTAEPDPTYADQAIKTSVAPEFVRSQQLSFPEGVYFQDVSHRDSDLDGFGDDLLRRSARYTWVPDSTGLRLATVAVSYLTGFTLFEDSAGTNPATNAPELFFGKLDARDRSLRPYRVTKPLVLELQITITITGLTDAEFDVDHSVEEVEVSSTFAPSQVGYAAEGNAWGAEQDELLIAGFTGHFYDGEPFQPTSDVSNVINWRHLTLSGFAVRHFALVSSPFGVTGSGTRRQAYNELSRYETYPIADFDDTDFGISLSVEATFDVIRRDSSVIFSRCVRRRLGEVLLADYFMAEVAGLDLRTGIVAFTMSESEFDQRWPDLESIEGVIFEHQINRGFVILRGSEQVTSWFQKDGIEGSLEHTPLGSKIPKTYTAAVSTHGVGALTSDLWSQDYVSAIFNEVDGGNMNINWRFFVDFPEGHRYYETLYQRHFAATGFIGGLVANEDVISFTGALFCLTDGMLRSEAESNKAVDGQTAFTKELDFLQFRNISTTHKAVWEQAFNRTIDLERSVHVEPELVETVALSGSETQEIYRNNLIIRDSGGTDIHKINMDEAWFWLYPGFRAWRGYGYGLFSQDLANPSGDAILSREQQTLLDPAFSGRAYGYTADD